MKIKKQAWPQRSNQHATLVPQATCYFAHSVDNENLLQRC
jgi:hypothetical protein